jgi:uncharacterized protein (UPF0276 family)
VVRLPPLTDLPELGVGVVYFRGLESLLETGNVDVIEVEPQTLWFETGDTERPYRSDGEAVDGLAAYEQAKLVHGVGFPVGGSRIPDERHLELLRQIITRFRSPWASEHLSFNEAAGPDGFFKTGFLLPPRNSPEGVAAAAATIREVSSRLPVPFAVETGVNYLRPRDDELSDGEFVAAVAKAADCGILLDIHNVWTNERNGRQPVRELVDSLPLERVWEVHVAGGHEFEGYWLDAHSGGVPDELLDVATWVVARLPNLKAIVFEISDGSEVAAEIVAKELDRLRLLWESRGSRPPAHPVGDGLASMSVGPTPADWEDALGALVVGRAVDNRLAEELTDDPGVALMRKLVQEFRAGMTVEALTLTCRLLMLTIGPESLQQLLMEYWAGRPPELFKSSEGEGFARFLKDRHLDITYLDDVLAYELAVMHSLARDENVVVKMEHDPLPLLRSLAAGELPTEVSRGHYEVELTAGDDPGPSSTGVGFGSATG